MIGSLMIKTDIKGEIHEATLTERITSYVEGKVNIWQASWHLASQQLPNNTSVDLLNLQWNIFKGLYIGAKTEILEDYRNEYLLDNNCCNSCIGNDKFRNDDICYKETKFMKPLQCCKSRLPCACEVKASFFTSKEKRFLTFEDAFDLAGYDINDLECMKFVGVPVAVSDAYPEIVAVARYVTDRPGGYGAVREVCDLVYKEKIESKAGAD